MQTSIISPGLFPYTEEQAHKQNREQQIEFSRLSLSPLNKADALLPLNSMEKFL